MVQEFGKHPSQGTEDLPIRLQYHEGWMLTEALSGRDGRPSEITVFVSENMIDFTSWDVTMALQLCFVHRAFCFSVPYSECLRMKQLVWVSFLFDLWCFSSETTKTLLCAWVLTSYVLVAVLLAPAKFSLEIYATSHLTINQVKKN